MAIRANNDWKPLLRIDTHPILNPEDYAEKITGWMKDMEMEQSQLQKAIISSVVPDATRPVAAALEQTFEIIPIILNAKTDTGIMLETDHPERVGSDLIADAAGAYALVQDTCIVVDFGTATTVMAVEKPGKLTGVAICAGLEASIEALVGKAAQLQDIPLELPPSPIGKNTVQAMQAGLVLGHICMVEGLIDRMKHELGPAKVVGTGGLVSLLSPHTDHFDRVEPMLTLDGLLIITERL
jgi:type III pantothenate kinase